MRSMNGSMVVIEEFHGKALESNPLGDPATRRVPVYLPPGYGEKQRYPSVYLLAGFGSRGLRFLNDDLWTENIPEQLDRLIGEGRVRPLIVVMPDASTRYGGSQYVNSVATGNYEDHILELVGYIDSKYPTIPDSKHRAIAGHSSGGFGALRFGMLHPDTFGLVADHSGDKYFEMGFKPNLGELLRYYETVGEAGLAALLQDPGVGLRNGAPHEVLSLLATAAAYSPNPKSPLGFDLPVDLHSGALRPDVWARWLAFDPVEIAGKYADALKSLRLLYLDCGRFDEYNLLYGARLFTEKSRALGIPFQYEEYDGSHRYMKHRYDISFAALSAAMTT
jgi:enterochelin esterase family protein